MPSTTATPAVVKCKRADKDSDLLCRLRDRRRFGDTKFSFRRAAYDAARSAYLQHRVHDFVSSTHDRSREKCSIGGRASATFAAMVISADCPPRRTPSASGLTTRASPPATANDENDDVELISLNLRTGRRQNSDDDDASSPLCQRRHTARL